MKLIYKDLPTSVFQADINSSNILLDENGKFVGFYDFNLCGKDVFLNYLFREVRGGSYDDELNAILRSLKIVSQFYKFSDIEKSAAALLYRCIKPLWYYRAEDLKKAGNDETKIRLCLDQADYAQTRTIDFLSVMK